MLCIIETINFRLSLVKIIAFTHTHGDGGAKSHYLDPLPKI